METKLDEPGFRTERSRAFIFWGNTDQGRGTIDSFRMNLRRVLIAALVMLLILGLGRNLFAAEVKIVQGKLFVNGEPFIIKGVAYSPVPIGVDPETTPPLWRLFHMGALFNL